MYTPIGDEGCLEDVPAVHTHTHTQCTPPLVEKAGVAPDVTLRFTVHNLALKPMDKVIQSPIRGPKKIDLGPTKNYMKQC